MLITQLQNSLSSSTQITPAQLRSRLTGSNVFLQDGWRRLWQDLIHYCSTNAGQSAKFYTTHTAAEQPAQFYANHASTAAEQPDQFKYIPTAWLEKTLARPNSLLQHKCRAVCQMLYQSHSCRAACSVLHKSHQHSCGAPGQGQMYSYSMVGGVPG